MAYCIWNEYIPLPWAGACRIIDLYSMVGDISVDSLIFFIIASTVLSNAYCSV